MSKYYTVFDESNGEFLKKFKIDVKKDKLKTEWSSCYHYGTQDIKLKDDIPFLFSNKQDALKTANIFKKDFAKKYPDEEKLNLSVLKAELTDAVIINWKG